MSFTAKAPRKMRLDEKENTLAVQGKLIGAPP
jgi:hypothetical protein